MNHENIGVLLILIKDYFIMLNAQIYDLMAKINLSRFKTALERINGIKSI